MSEPRWLAEARKHVGLTEIVGRKHNPAILRWWTLIRAPFTDDETPWCAGYVGGVLESVGIRSTRSAMARSYERWGVPVNPRVGAIVTFWRGSPRGGSGHVGFVVGKDKYGNLMVLGGNQGNAVSIKPFSASRVTSYRWPAGEQLLDLKSIPLVASDGRVSTNEA